MRRSWVTWLVVSAALVMVSSACAAGVNDASATGPQVAGFWLGLWQGLISPAAFLISLFDSGVGVYEVHNNGNWYDFGFMLGVALVFSGPARLGGRGSARGRRRGRDEDT